MTTLVYFCPVFSMSSNAIGNTSYEQSFHVFCSSIPEYVLLSTTVHPIPVMPS
jgi:hypothetical protein